MDYPLLTELPTSREFIDAFGGYNHNLRIGENEFYDMKNLTSTYYPILSPRDKRGTYLSAEESDADGNIIKRDVQGIIAKDNLCYVRNGEFYINHERVDGFDLDADGEKTLVSMGAYVIILPDKKYINVLETSDWGFIDNIKTTIHTDIDTGAESTSAVTLAPCDIDGNDIDITKGLKPDNPTDGQYWLDTSVKPNALKRWSESNSMWAQVPTTYVKISSTIAIGEDFKQYDGVKISGLKGVEFIEHTEKKKFYNDKLSAIDGNFVIQKCTNNYIVVIGILDGAYTIDNGITIERKMPTVDFLIESGNRLWGCKYGAIYDESEKYKETVNVIYASKLGDFKNWTCYMGLSTDSYYANCGTDGPFTGAVSHLGYPLFFKEDCIHKVYGNYPANFQIQTIAGRGVQRRCDKSLAIVNEVLYYKGKAGICAYDGSLPVEISSQLGSEQYTDAVSGWHGNKYYVSMKKADEYHLFVYDTVKGMWHREDNTHATAFANCNNELYYIEDGSIKTACGSGTLDTEPVEWMAETGVIGIYSPDKKYLSKLNIRLSLDIGTRVYFYVQYDSYGEWEFVCSLTGSRLSPFTIPIKPKRHDHMRLRIVGEGVAKIYSIAKTIEQGSDI